MMSQAKAGKKVDNDDHCVKSKFIEKLREIIQLVTSIPSGGPVMKSHQPLHSRVHSGREDLDGPGCSVTDITAKVPT